MFNLAKLQPDLSGALFWIGKALAKKAGTEGGKAAIKTKKNGFRRMSNSCPNNYNEFRNITTKKSGLKCLKPLFYF